MTTRKTTLFIVQAAVIAALYTVLTLVSAAFGLSSGVIQVRLSECLTVLPVFTPAAVPGLALGCVISNLVTGCALWDVVFGSLATLIGAVGTYLLRKHPFAAPVPPILSNMLIVPYLLSYVYGAEGTIPFFMLTVGAGEIISCGVFGTMLYLALRKHENIFKI
jgi:uncharacterized membrane protein